MHFLSKLLNKRFFVLTIFGAVVFCFWLAHGTLGNNFKNTSKWHPGHYITVGPRTNTLDFIAKHPSIVSDDHIRGILKKVYWGDLESNSGEYDFAGIDRILSELERSNKYLFLLVLDRSFSHGCSPGIPMPEYIYAHDNGRYRAELNNNRNGCAAAVWEPWVMDRFISLMRALGARYDINPSFHGISSPESALGTAESYDKESYKEQFIRLLQETRLAFPHSLVLGNLNYLSFDGVSSESNLTDIAEIVEEFGGGLSTPDSIPSRATPFNFIAQKFKGRVAIAPRADTSFIDLQQDTPFSIARFNIDSLGANFIFWAPWHRDDSSYLENVVLPDLREMIRNPKTYPELNTQCPKSIQCT